ncbi:helix-turn-helix domain-containing protein [Lutibaculum baratangense]|uniref:Transcriptional regulator, XRE family n=1 Tax=Lutibaculum baratangense AMV1 TaxID=631454 RepID=V4TMM1_9HYPH|nr:short-chain fatty acyl-CoA regulator family protein [Lutibaculum baratangense]ESR26993.1 Transcriptional regulator, XRE family [Lutibaculum baratangense AMV1]
MADAQDPQIGGRIRRLRRDRRLTQAELAQALGISASYLNLIEHNRRKITVPLLFKIAGQFGIEPGDLAETDDGRLAGDLMEMFGDDLFLDSDLTNQEIRDFAYQNPVVARAVMRLFDKYQDLVKNRASGAPSADAGDAAFHPATDEVSDFVQENANHFPALEAAAGRVRADVDRASDSLEQGLRTYLMNVFGVDCRQASLPRGIARRLSGDGRTLEISDILPPETANFAVAHHLGLMAAQGEIEAIIAGSTLPEADAPPLARNVLASYFAAAVIMPYEPFFKACQAHRYDIDRLMRRFQASFEQVCHRMTTLQRPGSQGIPLHLVRTDIAGNIQKRFSLSGIHIPRHSGACPRWNVYSAFLHPGHINVQLSQMPDGEVYFCIARSFARGDYSYTAPRRHLSIGLGCSISHARKMIYSDGVDLTKSSHVVPVGPSCRICPRLECGQRAHPPADHRFRLSDEMRAESLYGRIG